MHTCEEPAQTDGQKFYIISTKLRGNGCSCWCELWDDKTEDETPPAFEETLQWLWMKLHTTAQHTHVRFGRAAGLKVKVQTVSVATPPTWNPPTPDAVMLNQEAQTGHEASVRRETTATNYVMPTKHSSDCPSAFQVKSLQDYKNIHVSGFWSFEFSDSGTSHVWDSRESFLYLI